MDCTCSGASCSEGILKPGLKLGALCHRSVTESMLGGSDDAIKLVYLVCRTVQ